MSLNTKLYYVKDIEANMLMRGEKDLPDFSTTGVYEPEETALIKTMVKEKWTCLDVGANIGYFTILMAKRAKEVYAFEPEPENFELLLKNCILNHIENAKCAPFALGAFSTRTYLHKSELNNGMHRMYESKWCNKGKVMVDVHSLDEMCFLNNLDFIKMDIEGYEYAALLGMIEHIKKFKPVILMEFHPATIIEAGFSTYTLFCMLDQLGYLISFAPSFNPISYEELIKLANMYPMGGKNILCIPS